MAIKSLRRLNRRLLSAFLLQIALISATAVVGVYLADFAIRELLIVSALEREADYFWARHNIDVATPPPNTNSLIGYVFRADDTSAHPEEFQNLALGIHDITTPVGRSVVHVSEVKFHRLFLVFDANNVRELATYFGLVPLALLLIVLYSSAWVAYRISGRAVSPVVKLARSVRELNPNTDHEVRSFLSADLQGADDEVITLAEALEQLVDRINEFVERERQFTREASHELRSPLTVIKIASDLLLARDDLNAADRASAERIQRAASDMEELTQAFLLLAREADSGLAHEPVHVNEIARAEFSRCEIIYGHKSLAMSIDELGDLYVDASPKVVGVIIGNILRNACAYTDAGEICLKVTSRSVEITDSGVGMSNDEVKAVFSTYYRAPNARESGHGIGLSLVKRMTDRFGWSVEIDSDPGRGTHVTVTFPDSRFTPIAERPSSAEAPAIIAK